MMQASQQQHPWDQFKALKDEAYLYIDQGLRLEQTSKPDRALTMYERGLDKLDHALDLPIELPGSCESDLEPLRKNRTKMLRTRQEIVFRIRELQTDQTSLAAGAAGVAAVEAPPPSLPPPSSTTPPALAADDSAGGAAAAAAPSAAAADPVEPCQKSAMTSSSLNGDDQNTTAGESSWGSAGQPPPPSYAQATGESPFPLPSDALVLFQIDDNVSLFYINESGQVTTPYPPSSLHLYKFRDPAMMDTPAMLQVGSWVYPLVPGMSPVLQSSAGSYMFPDLDDSLSGNAVGLILPPEVTDDVKKGFEYLLNQLTAVKQSEDLSHYEDYMALSSHVAEGMTQGAEAIGRGLVRASSKGVELMKRGTVKLKENIAPTDEDKPVDPKVKASLEAASWTADKAVKVSGFLVSKAGMATVALGKFLAPHIQKGGVKALSHFVEQSEEKSQKQMKIVSEVASGSVAAVSTVYMALENSSKILAKNIGENTVEVVRHRYGTEVGAVTEHALSAAGNAYLTVYNAGALAPKGLAKRLAKDTGKVAVGVADNVLRGDIRGLEQPTLPGPVNDTSQEEESNGANDTTTKEPAENDTGKNTSLR